MAVTLIELDDVDSTGLADGQILVWNAAAGKWKPGSVGSGGGGASDHISNANGSVSLDANGNVLISGKVASINGKVTDGYRNGVWASRNTSEPVYGGSDITGVKFYDDVGGFAGIWYVVRVIFVVLQPAATGTLDFVLSFRDVLGEGTVKVIEGADITKTGRITGDSYISTRGNPSTGASYGLWRDIVGHGVTGSGINVNVLINVEEQ
jgi:hypothetical protein